MLYFFFFSYDNDISLFGPYLTELDCFEQLKMFYAGSLDSTKDADLLERLKTIDLTDLNEIYCETNHRCALGITTLKPPDLNLSPEIIDGLVKLYADQSSGIQPNS